MHSEFRVAVAVANSWSCIDLFTYFRISSLLYWSIPKLFGFLVMWKLILIHPFYDKKVCISV